MCHYGSIREAQPLVCGYIVYLFPSEFSWKLLVNRSYIIFSTRIHEGRMLSVLFATILLSGPLRGCRVKESACQCRRQRRCEFDPWIMKIRWRRKRQLTPVFLLRKFRGQESLGCYSPGSHKESETTERLRTHMPNVPKTVSGPNRHWAVLFRCRNVTCYMPHFACHV